MKQLYKHCFFVFERPITQYENTWTTHLKKKHKMSRKLKTMKIYEILIKNMGMLQKLWNIFPNQWNAYNKRENVSTKPEK